jgi:hypothetical protein
MKPIRNLLLLRSNAIRRLSWVWWEFLRCTAIGSASLYGVPPLMDELTPNRGEKEVLDHVAMDETDV